MPEKKFHYSPLILGIVSVVLVFFTLFLCLKRFGARAFFSSCRTRLVSCGTLCRGFFSYCSPRCTGHAAARAANIQEELPPPANIQEDNIQEELPPANIQEDEEELPPANIQEDEEELPPANIQEDEEELPPPPPPPEAPLQANIQEEELPPPPPPEELTFQEDLTRELARRSRFAR
jgi:hypothetical protein